MVPNRQDVDGLLLTLDRPRQYCNDVIETV